MYACLCMVSILMCSRNPEFAIKSEPVKDDNEDEEPVVIQKIDKGVSINDALTSGKFWLISLILFNGLFFGLYMASVFKFAAQGTITDDKYLTLAGAVGSVCNGSSRVIWASL